MGHLFLKLETDVLILLNSLPLPFPFLSWLEDVLFCEGGITHLCKISSISSQFLMWNILISQNNNKTGEILKKALNFLAVLRPKSNHKC